MTRPTVFAILALCLASVASAQMLASAYTAKLTKAGDGVVDPKVKSSGSVTLKPSANMMMMSGTVSIKNVVNFIAAHIHLGNATTNGPVIVFAWTLDGSNTVPPVTGTFTFPFMFNTSMLDLNTLNMEGYYFNVHTVKYPAGELRGQLMPKKM